MLWKIFEQSPGFVGGVISGGGIIRVIQDELTLNNISLVITGFIVFIGLGYIQFKRKQLKTKRVGPPYH